MAIRTIIDLFEDVNTLIRSNGAGGRTTAQDVRTLFRNMLDTVLSLLDTKVSRVSGKQLSTEDFTTAEKQKLAGIDTNTNLVTNLEKTTWNDKLDTSGGIMSGTLKSEHQHVLLSKKAGQKSWLFHHGAGNYFYIVPTALNSEEGDWSNQFEFRDDGELVAKEFTANNVVTTPKVFISGGGNIAADARIGFLTSGSQAQSINVGSVLVSNDYTDASKVPVNGMWVKGDMWVGSHLTAAGNVTAYSDARLKKDINSYKNGLEKVMSLKPVTYNRIDTGKFETGFIAQDVENVDRTLVVKNNDEEGTLSLDYSRVVVMLTKAVQEQQEQIEELKMLLKRRD